MELYNFCLETSDDLELSSTESAKCINGDYPWYKGAVLKKFNNKTIDKCENYMLPHMLFKSV